MNPSKKLRRLEVDAVVREEERDDTGEAVDVVSHTVSDYDTTLQFVVKLNHNQLKSV